VFVAWTGLGDASVQNEVYRGFSEALDAFVTKDADFSAKGANEKRLSLILLLKLQNFD
jgi:hypothetical protein